MHRKTSEVIQVVKLEKLHDRIPGNFLSMRASTIYVNVVVIMATFACTLASKSSLKLEMPAHTFKAPLNYGMLFVLFFDRLIRQRTGGMDGLRCVDFS